MCYVNITTTRQGYLTRAQIAKMCPTGYRVQGSMFRVREPENLEL